MDKELGMKHTSQFNLHEDLYLSDDSVKDPDYEQPDHVLRELDTEIMDTFSDSDNEESIVQVITQAQIHVTSPFKALNESFSILREDIQNDLFNTAELIDTITGSDNVQSTVEVVTSDQIHVSSPSQHQDEIDSILRVDTDTVDFHAGAVNNNPSENIIRNPIDTVAERNIITCEEITDDLTDRTVTNTKKGRSRKEREKCKKQRNAGQSYVTEKGKEIPERQLRLLSNCRLKCMERFSESERKQCFEEYWALGSRDRRAMFIANLLTILPKKTQKTDSRTLNRDCFCKYKLLINNEEKPICKECFCRTFGETKGFVNIVMVKKKESGNGIIPIDSRGKQPSKNKKSVDDITSAKEHILSFPSYESHYCRKRTDKKYLPADLSIAAMYRKYKETCANPVSLKLYSQCFHDLNLSFKKPAKDTCHTCDLLNTKISLAEGEESLDLKVQLAEHQSLAEKAYSEKRNDKDRAKCESSFRAYTFDLQQCLPTPYLKTSVSFYKRQLWSFNLTIHDLENDKATCYMWDETIGARGSNQIASCLWHFLQNLPAEVKEVTFYSDTCGGQNKNNTVAMMFTYLLHVHPTLQTINHKFLVSGHSHMECDSDHALIEKAKKKTQLKINHLNDWVQLVRSSKINKPFTVVQMKLENFLNFAELAKKTGPFTVKKKDVSGNKFLWQPVKWLQYKKPAGEIRFKTDIDIESPFEILNIKKRGKCKLANTKLQVVSTHALPISKEKKKDLMDLLPLIDPVFHEFFKNIETDGNTPNIDPDLDFEDPDLVETEEQID